MRKIDILPGLVCAGFLLLGLFWSPGAKAQNAELASPPEMEYNLIDGAEIWHPEGQNVTAVYAKKTTSGPKSNARMSKPQNSTDDPPVVVIIDENGCSYGCTEHGWDPMDCPGWSYNPNNPPKTVFLIKKETTEPGMSKFAIAKSVPGAPFGKHPVNKFTLNRKSGGGGPEPAGIYVCGGSCCPQNCLWIDRIEPDKSTFLAHIPNGAILINKPDKSVLCLHPNGTVTTDCGALPSYKDLAKRTTKEVTPKN